MIKNKKVLIAHGSGGKLSGELVKRFFIDTYGNQTLKKMTDSAILDIGNSLIAFTTDSYVVDPIFFPGGDIGKLAVCGTVNDLSVSGAKPLFISAAYIIEEGFLLNDLEKISTSMAREATNAGVQIVTGDTKVVNKGKCDKIFINTAGIGIIKKEHEQISSGSQIKPEDILIINGYIGDHGIAVLGAREKINFENELVSDCASLNLMIEDLLNAGIHLKFMRDLTRGGLGTVLAELTEDKTFGVLIDEQVIPIRETVKGTCEIFGFDPLYLANEGKVLIVVDKNDAELTLRKMQGHSVGKKSAIIGKVTTEHNGKAILNSVVGGKRIIDKLTGEMLPRIC